MVSQGWAALRSPAMEKMAAARLGSGELDAPVISSAWDVDGNARGHVAEKMVTSSATCSSRSSLEMSTRARVTPVTFGRVRPRWAAAGNNEKKD